VLARANQEPIGKIRIKPKPEMRLDNAACLAIFRSVQAKGAPFAQVFYGSSASLPAHPDWHDNKRLALLPMLRWTDEG
jgi:hypothetical protein